MPTPKSPAESEFARRTIGHHTTPEEAGMVFDRVKPKLALYSHIVFLDDSTLDGVAPTREDSPRRRERRFAVGSVPKATHRFSTSPVRELEASS